MRRIFLLGFAFLVLALPSSFNACSAPNQFEGGTLVGNPKMQMSSATYTSASLTDFSFCLTGVNLTGGTTQQALPVFPTLVGLSPEGVTIGEVEVPMGDYTRVELSLTNACGTSESVHVNNNSGVLNTNLPVTLSFTGSFTVNQSEIRIQFNVSSIITALEAATQSSEIKTRSEMVTGTLTQITDGTPDTWTNISVTGAPSARTNTTGVWTGSEMIIWGGTEQGPAVVNTGARYNPATDSWSPTTVSAPTLTSVPALRHSHSAVWTGTEMIVWGGFGGFAGNTPLNTGGKYNPASNTWVQITTIGTPSVRRFHSAVWSGTEMIVWGGNNLSTDLNTGGKYNPQTDTWTSMTIVNAPVARIKAVALWTASQMFIWSGNSQAGGLYNPATDVWSALSTVNEPVRRTGAIGVWTGTEVIVWGGEDRDIGGRYNPATDTWTQTASFNGRTYHTGVWTGTELLIWGGYTGPSPFTSGLRYNPSTNIWSAFTSAGAPSARRDAFSFWTGQEMIVWGGVNGLPLNTGGRYRP